VKLQYRLGLIIAFVCTSRNRRNSLVFQARSSFSALLVNHVSIFPPVVLVYAVLGTARFDVGISDEQLSTVVHSSARAGASYLTVL
jgi:hypothetical protein